MNFEKYVSNFMSSYDIDLSPKPIGYYKDLMVFYDYLKSRDVTDNNIDEFVRGLDTNTIISSIDYYIKENSIKKISTVQRYVSAVKEFLLYIISNDYVSNDAFLKELGSPAYKEGSFRNKINIYLAENSELDKSTSYDPLTQYEVEDLIKECNLVLEISITKVTRSKEMNMITSALIIKLILLTGIPYREIIKIPVESYYKTIGSFSIDGISIRLPEGLIKQFNCYLELREKIAQGGKELFITYRGKPLPKGTAQVVYWLKQLSGRQDLTGLIKFAIVQMMDLNINHIAIEKFTKVGFKIIMSCKEQFINEQGFLLGIEFDSLLRRSPVFDKL
ncbi:hypothetical protein EHV15_26590 [Paenibacillus oralis]|uniref:Uncharacterized protein n=1 Tax=Paenibacillus oralis TaxID=2490856 RepID=A0A3P3UCA3_9BACL|nr:hypothetical protein [Paenibacillus oralis]RRJ66083.1 hypothetical protein EHV15_26590 [Paenibacillus oralis]